MKEKEHQRGEGEKRESEKKKEKSEGGKKTIRSKRRDWGKGVGKIERCSRSLRRRGKGFQKGRFPG